MVFRAVVFTFVPTAVELVLVCGLLGRIFQPLVAVLVVATFVTYVLWTAQLTQAAAKVNYQKICKSSILYCICTAGIDFIFPTVLQIAGEQSTNPLH